MKSKSIYFDKCDFEKDLLKVLKKYGLNTNLVTKLDIKCRVDKIPVVKIVYGKQYCSLKDWAKKIVDHFYFKIRTCKYEHR